MPELLDYIPELTDIERAYFEGLDEEDELFEELFGEELEGITYQDSEQE